MKKSRLAAIDIGTNTFRLLIAEVHTRNEKPGTHPNYSISEIYSERIITRLGEGISDNGHIHEKGMSRGIDALKKFGSAISDFDVCRTSAVATSALREAKNSGEFLDKAKEASGLEISVITGEEEARITTSGMLMDMTPPDSAILVDIGGGSTELILTGNNGPQLVRSLGLGVVYLAGKYMTSDPPIQKDLKQMEDEITDAIKSSVGPFSKLFTVDTVFIGTAGTVTALAAMSQGLSVFEHSKIHEYRLSRDRVKDIFTVISALSSDERAERLPFELSRLDIIVPGALILSKLMEHFNFDEITVSDYGLREGILINLYENLK